MDKIRSLKYIINYRDMLKDDIVIMNKKVLIIGAGNAGRPTANLLKYLGNDVKVSEIKKFHELPRKARKKIRLLEGRAISTEFGFHDFDDFLWADMVFISPNVPLDSDIRHHISKYLKDQKIKEITTKDIGRILNSLLDIPLVGIAGTDGKTTTTNMINYCLKDIYNPLIFSSIQDSLVIEGLVEMFVDEKIENKDAAVFELPHGTIRMVEGLEICVGVLTNLTPDHMDEFDSFEEYVSRNISIKDLIHKNGILIANGDDPIISQKASDFNREVIFYGCNESRTLIYEGKAYPHNDNLKLDVIADDVELKGLYGSQFIVKIGIIPTAICENCGKICCSCVNFKRKNIGPFDVIINLKIPGMCNIENAVATLTTGLVLGLDLEYLKDKIESFSGIKGRFEKISTIDNVNVFMDAAHNPEGMERLLDGLNLDGRLIITVDNPDTLTVRDKFKIGEILARYADVVVASAKNETTEKIDRNAAKEVTKGAKAIKTYQTMNVTDAIIKALQIADKGDTIIHIGPGVVNAYDDVKSDITRGIESYRNSKPNIVVVGGCGTVGSLMARVLKDKGAEVTVSDISTNNPTIEILEREGINLDLGGHNEKILKSADTVVLAPSLLENRELIEKIKKVTDADIISIEEVLDICKVNKTVVGITGTNGKTTTTWILKNILNQAGYNVPEHELDIQGNTELIPPLQARLNGDVAVLEIGTFGNLNEIKRCAFNSEVNIGIITNISEDHLNGASKFSDYIKCKAEIVDVADLMVLNADDPVVSSFSTKNPDNTLFYGIETLKTNINPYSEQRKCPICNHKLKYSKHYLGHLGLYKCSCGFKRPEPDVKAYDVDDDSFILGIGTNRTRIKLKKKGIWNVYNSLAAACGALVLGVDFEDIVKGIESFDGVKGRFEEIEIGKRVIIDYAHNPAGVKAIIQTLVREKRPNSRLIVINTISSESGIEGDVEIANILRDADVIIVASNASRKAISKVKMEAHLTESSKKSSRKGTLGASKKQVKEGLKMALNIAEDNDIILIIGEGGVKYSAQILEEFDN